MATGTNAIAVFLDFSGGRGVASGYQSNNKLKAITNLELKDHTVYKYDSSNLKKCVKYSDIKVPRLTTYLANSMTVSMSTSVTYYLGSILIIYRFPKYSGSFGSSGTPESAVVSIENLRSDCTVSTQSGYTYTVNNSECTGSFQLNIKVLSDNRVQFSVWRKSSVTLSASQYNHIIYRNTTPYCFVYVKKQSVNNEPITYSIPIYFGLQVMLPTSS